MNHRTSNSLNDRLASGSCLAAFVLLLSSTSLAIAQSTTEKVFERLVEDEKAGTLVLQFPVRRFERQGMPGPVVTTHGMVHIADRLFYEKHQQLLNPLDVVLFEVVLPPGTGRPQYSLQDTESTEWKIKTTQMRLRTLAMMAESYAMREGKLPTSFDDIQRWDPGVHAISDRLAKDAWGNDFHFSLDDSEMSFELSSWGEDNEIGGDGPDADIVLSAGQSRASGWMQPSSMHRMAEYLGLIHQGDVEKHELAHWRSSDLSDDQVGERLAMQGMPNETKKNADAWMPQSVLETMSELSQVIPGLKDAGKVFFLDILAASPIAQQDFGSDPFSKVIIEDRNQVVVDDLSEILKTEPNITSVGIVYGAAHMPGIEAQLIEMGYQETKVDWIDAITVSLPQSRSEREQLQLSRNTIRSMGLLGGKETPGEGNRKRWRKSNTSEEALAQNYRKEILREWVGMLAKRLDADEPKERDEAEMKILAMGTIVIPFLPAFSEDDSEEFRTRLERIRSTLLARDKESITRPSRVTLLGAMTGRDALESISQQTGNTLRLENVPGLDVGLNLDIDDMLFWEALDEVLDRLNLTILPDDGEVLNIVPRKDVLPPRFLMASYSGSFRLEPVAITKAQRLYEPGLNTASIELFLSWEPRLRPVFFRYVLEGLELKCDNGEVLRPIPDQGTDFTPSGSQLLSVIEFDPPSRSAKEITEWKGTIVCDIPGQAVAIRFKDLVNARNETSTQGDLEVTLERTRKNRNIHEVLIGIALQGEQAEGSMEGWTNVIDAYLEDAQGKRMDNSGWSTTRITDREIGLSFLFESKDLSEYQFVLVAPDSITRHSIQYSIGGIALP